MVFTLYHIPRSTRNAQAGTPKSKWLDIPVFCEFLTDREHEINDIKYFTSIIKTHSHDPTAVEHQNLYLQAISAKWDVKTFFGYNKKLSTLPSFDSAAYAPCQVVE